MQNLPTVTESAPEATEDPVPQTQSAAPSDEVYSTELLITEQEVLFGTAAAVPLQRRKIGRRLVAMLFAMSTAASRPRARYYPTRADYLERALMAREMDRLWNAVIAAGSAAPLVAVVVYDLHSWLERWDYERHREDWRANLRYVKAAAIGRILDEQQGNGTPNNGCDIHDEGRR